MFRIRTAVLRGYRPTFLLFGTQPDSEWDDNDRDMLTAFQKMQDETKGETGLPIWLTRSFDTNLEFSVQTVDDGAQRALQMFDKKQADSKTPKYGQARFVVPHMLDDSPLLEGGLAREAFFREYGEYMKQLTDTADGPDIERMPPGGYDPSEYGDGLVESP